MRYLRWRLGLKNFVAVDCVGKSGGLAVFWHESVEVTLRRYSQRFIDLEVKLQPSAPIWRLTFVYGEPRVEDRKHMWELLMRIIFFSNLPWLVMGDFNEAMWGSEHFSATPRNERQMANFREALNVCELFDLGFTGVPYTYDNKREGMQNVKVRLDRAVADNAWCDLFGEAKLKHLISSRSDHCPILLQFEKEMRSNLKNKPPRYEIMWERESILPEIIKEAWKNSSRGDLGQIALSLKEVMTTLTRWSKEKFGSINKELALLRKQLEEEGMKGNSSDPKVLRYLSDRMDEILRRDDVATKIPYQLVA